jgi:hypothetical protein
MLPTTLRFLAAAAALACTASVAAAGQGDPTPRKDIEPWDKAKVISIEAQQWGRFGTQAVRTDTRSGNIPGKQSCTTTVGAPPPPANQQPLRFGPQPKSQTVVVTGSVINVCK